MAVRYATVKIPLGLANRINEVVISREMYRTVSEFVIESTRQRLEGIERNKN